MSLLQRLATPTHPGLYPCPTLFLIRSIPATLLIIFMGLLTGPLQAAGTAHAVGSASSVDTVIRSNADIHAVTRGGSAVTQPDEEKGEPAAVESSVTHSLQATTPSNSVSGSSSVTTSADTLQLDEIVIRSTRLPAPQKYQPVAVHRLDSLTIGHLGHHAISELLSRYSALFIQDNGPGAMATLSQRGLSAGQTQVLWEGFPINSLSRGLTDLSLIPAAMTGSVEISPGTPSSAFGGGSLGGIIYLSAPDEPERDRLNLYQSIGAFNSWNSGGTVALSQQQWSLSLNALYHSSDNDFRYFNRASNRYERRLNNSRQATHLQASLRYRLDRGRLYTTLWYADSDNHLPGSILSSDNPARQRDGSFRWTAGIERPVGDWVITAGAFLEQSMFRFREPSTRTDSRFTMARRMVRADLRRPEGDVITWQGGISGGYEWVETNNYAGTPDRLQAAVTLNPVVRFTSAGLRLYPTLRLDGYRGTGWIVSPSLGINQQLVAEELFLRGLVSRDFNQAAFNDLYWVPGGNPDLEPERSVRAEGGLLYLPPSPLLESLEITLYRIWLEKGIYWLPGERGVWSPENLDRVDAMGFEAGTRFAWQTEHVRFQWRTDVDWRRASLAAARFPGDLAVGRQMRYVPEWTLRSHLHAAVGRFDLMLQVHRTGVRHVTEDHTVSLDPFWTVNATGAVRLPLFNQEWRLQLALHNLLDQSYQIIQWYPMPGRYLEVTLAVDLPL